jgi:beta-glucosidase-like glycosyl hydrolase
MLCNPSIRISELERELSSQERVKIDLAKRVKMLEFALKEERAARASGVPLQVASARAPSPTSVPAGSTSSTAVATAAVPEPVSLLPSPAALAAVASPAALAVASSNASDHVEPSSPNDFIVHANSSTSAPVVLPSPPTVIEPVLPASEASFDSNAPLTVAEIGFLISSTCTANSMVNSVSAEMPSWRPSVSLRSHLDGVRSICFHSDDPWLVSASEDGTAKIWQLGSVIKVGFHVSLFALLL